MSRYLYALCALSLLGGCSILYDSSLPEDCEVEDFDGDGALSFECAPNPNTADCDDEDPEVNPSAVEVCNLEDDDCDDRFDEGLPTRDYFRDCDGDGAGDAAFAVLGCDEPLDGELPCPDGSAPDWVTEAGDCDDQNPERQFACGSCAQVDFLIVMDTSNSMAEEQISLAMQLPRIVGVLKTGDIDLDGTPEAEPITDLNVGVITPDLGAGDFVVPTCDRGFGDDGILQTESGIVTSCDTGLGPSTPPFLSFSPEESVSVEEFTQSWSCLVRQGTGGCGFEQPLEAALKAVTPAASTLRFRDDTLGHGDGLNFGFVRDDSVLVVLFVTDEDDCSAEDPELFWPESSRYPGDLNLRCFEYGADAVYPISRYVSGLLQVRDAEDLIIGLVAGIPEDLVPTHGIVEDYDALLRDPRLTERPAADGTRLESSCGIPGRGLAFPPRRLIEAAGGLQDRGAISVISSICSADSYTNIAEAILLAAVDNSAERCGFGFSSD